MNQSFLRNCHSTDKIFYGHMLRCGAGMVQGVHQCETDGEADGLDGRGLCIVKFMSVLIT